MQYKVARCKLRELLAERGITQSDLAKTTNITFTSISAYVNNSRSMYLGNAKTIATALGITIDELFEWKRVN